MDQTDRIAYQCATEATLGQNGAKIRTSRPFKVIIWVFFSSNLCLLWKLSNFAAKRLLSLAGHYNASCLLVGYTALFPDIAPKSYKKRGKKKLKLIPGQNWLCYKSEIKAFIPFFAQFPFTYIIAIFKIKECSQLSCLFFNDKWTLIFYKFITV